MKDLKDLFSRTNIAIPNKNEVGTNDNPKCIRELLDASYLGVKRLFVIAYSNVANNENQVNINSFKKYFLPRIKIENYNIEIDGRNSYD